jgi:hypothetical protein
MAEKNRSLEAMLGQLERAELKAAKEARKRMDAERLMKRIDVGFDQLVNLNQASDNGAGAPSAGTGAGAGAGAGAAFMYRSNLVNHSAAPSASHAERIERLQEASLSVQERIKLKGWHTPSR